MALGDNPIVALYDPADDLTAAVTAAIGAGKFVKPGATFQGGPLLDTSSVSGPLTKGNLPVVSLCGAGQRAIGVTKWDTVAADDVVGLYCGNQVVPMIAGAAITFGQKVMSDAAGLPTPWVTAAAEANDELGVAMSTAAGAATVYIKLKV